MWPTGNYMLDMRIRMRENEILGLNQKLNVMRRNYDDPKFLVPSKEKQKMWIKKIEDEIAQLERKNRQYRW